MTLKSKHMTHVAMMTLFIALAVWISLRTLAVPKAQHVVGVVEIGEIQ